MTPARITSRAHEGGLDVLDRMRVMAACAPAVIVSGDDIRAVAAAVRAQKAALAQAEARAAEVCASIESALLLLRRLQRDRLVHVIAHVVSGAVIAALVGRLAGVW